MIYWILGYIITLIGCAIFLYYTNDVGLTIGKLMLAIIFSIIPIIGQALGLLGICDYIDRKFNFSWIVKMLNKRIF